jgi:hypothetical protein
LIGLRIISSSCENDSRYAELFWGDKTGIG